MATLLSGIPAVDPPTLEKWCRNQDPPIPTERWWGKANSFTLEPGRKPGRGWILLTKRDLDTLDLTEDLELKFVGTDAAHSLTLKKITLLGRECVTPGAEADANAIYVCEVVDRRYHLPRIGLPERYRAYNVKNSQGDDYLKATTNDGDPWAWQGVVDDLAFILDEDAAQFALPVTPDGVPGGLRFDRVSAWEALNRVLDRLACTVAYDPTTDTFSVARLDELLGALADKDKNLSRYDDKPRLWDGYSSEPARAWRPEKVRVSFLRRPTATDGSSPYYTTDIPLPNAADQGVKLGSVVELDDDLIALGESGTPTNSADLDARAQERADDWLRKRQYYERPVLRVWRDFLPTAGSLAGYAVGRVAFDDRGGPFSTAVKAEPDGSIEAFRPMGDVPGWVLTGDSAGAGCGWPAALDKNDCLRVSVISSEGRCGCAEVSEEEVKLTSTDGIRWGVDPEHIGTGSGCLLGVTLPDTGTVQAVFDVCFFASLEPLVLVGEQHWSTDGEGFWGESPIHLECVDGAWRMWQDLSSLELPDNEGTLVSQECRNTLGDPVATIIFDFATNYLDGSLCLGEGAPTPTGQMVFEFRIEDEAGCGEGGPKLNICGTDYPVTFEKNCCGLPKLILTGFESAEACCGEDFAGTIEVTVTKDDVTYTGEWSGDGTSYSGDLEAEEEPPECLDDSRAKSRAKCSRDQQSTAQNRS